MTRQKMILAGARAFRENGVDGVGIAQVMSGIGRTHGGFYAHFPDRDAFVAESTRHAATESLALIDWAIEKANKSKTHAVETIIQVYLSDEHLNDVENGCLLPSLTIDLARQAESVRSAFSDSLRLIFQRVADVMPGSDADGRMESGMALISSLAGALMLARAINSPQMRKRFLRSTSKQLTTLFAQAQ